MALFNKTRSYHQFKLKIQESLLALGKEEHMSKIFLHLQVKTLWLPLNGLGFDCRLARNYANIKMGEDEPFEAHSRKVEL